MHFVRAGYHFIRIASAQYSYAGGGVVAKGVLVVSAVRPSGTSLTLCSYSVDKQIIALQR